MVRSGLAARLNSVSAALVRGSTRTQAGKENAAVDLTPERTLRAALYRGDGAAVMTVLTGDGRGLLQSMPQLVGDGLVCALAAQLSAAQQLAAELVAGLRRRAWDGDAELADQLDPPTPDPGQPPLQPLHMIDLEQLAAILEGDPRDGGGRIDLTTGEVWPQPAFDYGDLTDDEEDEDEDTSRWLRVDCEGSRASYHDMAEFITTIPDPDLADRLELAIHGKGAFGRFENQLAHHPRAFDRWFTFSAERQRGRARQWLASNGYRPEPKRRGEE
jgi:hypothetical protein